LDLHILGIGVFERNAPWNWMLVVFVEDWKIGRLGDWKIERLKDWKIGRLGDWKIERLKDWGVGKLKDWKIDGLED